MSEVSAYEQLGVTEDSSFEEIQTAKKSLQQKYQNDSNALEAIEAAYDAIIMDRLRMRQEGKIKVPDQIRFAEKIVETKSTSVSNRVSSPINTTPTWLKNLIDTPTSREIIITSLTFLILGIITVFSQTPETLPLLLTIGIGTSFYFLYRKDRLFWRTIGIVFSVFIVGLIASTLLANLLVSAGLSITIGQEQFVCLFSFCLLWLTSNYFR